MNDLDAVAGYMRVAAMSIFIYDWIITLPMELNLCASTSEVILAPEHLLHHAHPRSSLSPPSLSHPLRAYSVRQYLALIALLTNLVGFFSHFFVEDPHGTDIPCHHFASVMPIMQCLAAWASHAVFVFRTVAICNNERLIMVIFAFLAVVVAGVELFSMLWSYKFDVGPTGNCILKYDERSKISYMYYLAGTLFDGAVITVTYHSLAVIRGSSLFEFLWNSSAVYFCVTTVVNINNMVFYAVFSNNHETMLCAMGIAITSMMSARVILHTQERARQRRSSRHMRQLPSVDRRTPSPLTPAFASAPPPSPSPPPSPVPVIDIRRQSGTQVTEEEPQPTRQMTCESTYANSLYLPQMDGLYRMSNSSRTTFVDHDPKHDSDIGVLEPVHIRPSTEKRPSLRDVSLDWRPPSSAPIIIPGTTPPKGILHDI
ncbi:hypothetical protein EV714DRAFT_284262 [Schizophyllum commune]